MENKNYFPYTYQKQFNMKKFKNDDQELIRSILGKDKFLMLNTKLLMNLGPNAACMITYLLDKLDFLLMTKQIASADEPFQVYRRDFKRSLSLSPYQQKVIEKDLYNFGILFVEEKRYQGETWNDYQINLEALVEVIDSTHYSLELPEKI